MTTIAAKIIANIMIPDRLQYRDISTETERPIGLLEMRQ